jgi:CheY-like chemotaxis protein
MDKRPDSKPAGKTILIVDDEFAVLEVLEFVLADMGYSIVTAANGRDAMARVQEAKPELIVLDFMLPIMDGAAVLAALAANPQYSAIPVILTSALPEETVKQRCKGYSLFLRKPYKIDPLLNAIAGLLNTAEVTVSKPKAQ